MFPWDNDWQIVLINTKLRLAGNKPLQLKLASDKIPYNKVMPLLPSNVWNNMYTWNIIAS